MLNLELSNQLRKSVLVSDRTLWGKWNDSQNVHLQVCTKYEGKATSVVIRWN
jgi:hypothetical protein